MNRYVFLGASALLVAGCGQWVPPGWQPSGTTQSSSQPTQVASAPAPVIYEIHQDAPQPAAITNTNTVEVRSAAEERVVVVRESPRYVYRTVHRPPLIRRIFRPVVRRFFHPPRPRPRYSPPPKPPRPPKPKPPKPPVDPPKRRTRPMPRHGRGGPGRR